MMSNKQNSKADDFRNVGNSFYKKGKFEDALISYNISLCYALPDSQQLGLAYANRSAIYLELKLFDHCLTNIQLARNSDYPKEQLPKLKEREKKCNNLKIDYQPDLENDASSFFKLSYPANEKIPFIANCMELRENKKYGRHIITNRDLNPGDVISIEEPFLKIVHPNGRYKRCWNCFKSNMLNLIPCSGYKIWGCTSTMFCNQECLNEAIWQHRPECSRYFDDVIARSDNELREIEATVALRTRAAILQSLDITQSVDLLRDFMNDSSSKTIFDFDLSSNDQDANNVINLEIVNSLMAKSDPKIENDYMQVVRDRLNILKTLINLKVLMKSKDDEEDIIKYATRLMLICQRNAFSLWTIHNNVIEGSGILPFGSLFNHSCIPNVLRVVYENKIAFVVSKPVAKNEQLFICYGPTAFNLDIKLRKEYYLLKCNFECTCTACTNNYDPLKVPFYDPTFNFYRENSKTFKEAAEEFKKNCEYIKKNFKFYPSGEVFFLLERNCELLMSFERLSAWPLVKM